MPDEAGRASSLGGEELVGQKEPPRQEMVLRQQRTPVRATVALQRPGTCSGGRTSLAPPLGNRLGIGITAPCISTVQGDPDIASARGWRGTRAGWIGLLRSGK